MNEEENHNEENHNEENQNENGSSKEKESLKKVVTRKQPAKAKINIKTEAQKKEASSKDRTDQQNCWLSAAPYVIYENPKSKIGNPNSKNQNWNSKNPKIQKSKFQKSKIQKKSIYYQVRTIIG